MMYIISISVPLGGLIRPTCVLRRGDQKVRTLLKLLRRLALRLRSVGLHAFLNLQDAVLVLIEAHKVEVEVLNAVLVEYVR